MFFHWIWVRSRSIHPSVCNFEYIFLYLEASRRALKNLPLDFLFWLHIHMIIAYEEAYLKRFRGAANEELIINPRVNGEVNLLSLRILLRPFHSSWQFLCWSNEVRTPFIWIIIIIDIVRGKPQTFPKEFKRRVSNNGIDVLSNSWIECVTTRRTTISGEPAINRLCDYAYVWSSGMLILEKKTQKFVPILSSIEIEFKVDWIIHWSANIIICYWLNR